MSQLKPEQVKVRLVTSGRADKTTFVIGSTGCGKTTLIANLLEQEARFIVFDTKGDFPAEFFNPVPVVVQTAEDMAKAMNAGAPRIIVQMWHAPSMEKLLDTCSRFIIRWHTANQMETTYALDEFGRFCANNQCSAGVQEVILRGRSVGLKKLLGAQWFGNLPSWARDSFSELYVFKHNDPAGLDRFEKHGLPPELLRTLPLYHCAVIKGNEVRVIKLTSEKVKKSKSKPELTDAPERDTFGKSEEVSSDGQSAESPEEKNTVNNTVGETKV